MGLQLFICAINNSCVLWRKFPVLTNNSPFDAERVNLLETTTAKPRVLATLAHDFGRVTIQQRDYVGLSRLGELVFDKRLGQRAIAKKSAQPTRRKAIYSQHPDA